MKTKEAKFRVTTERHDLDTKVKHIKRWLSEGDKAKIVVQMRGREQAHPEVALRTIAHIIEMVGLDGKIAVPPKHEGRLVTATLANALTRKRA